MRMQRDRNRGENVKGLVLVGHGSKLPHYLEVMSYHKERIESMGIFNEVRLAFVYTKPHVDEVVKEMKSNEIYIVPVFISHGVHTTKDIPESLGLKGGADRVEGIFDGKRIVLCSPIGFDPLITYAILNSVFGRE
jgi:sirohydrochlorin ferrochelatase